MKAARSRAAEFFCGVKQVQQGLLTVFLLLAAFVVDDIQRRFVDQRDSFRFSDFYHLSQRSFQENSRDFDEFAATSLPHASSVKVTSGSIRLAA